ncbi:hypothetical protein BX667DRAFT_198282 [Coemansia mojavensis]|nr:hypothetical protein BX667DRAFT_198282 [Coemansia mojavensis]
MGIYPFFSLLFISPIVYCTESMLFFTKTSDREQSPDDAGSSPIAETSTYETFVNAKHACTRVDRAVAVKITDEQMVSEILDEHGICSPETECECTIYLNDQKVNKQDIFKDLIKDHESTYKLVLE